MSPRSFFFCLLVAIPSGLVAKLMAAIFDSFIRGIYQGARWGREDFFIFLTQFISCGLSGFVFVWVGALMTQKYRSFSVWIFATIAIAAAAAIASKNNLESFAGQSTGALIAATLFWNGPSDATMKSDFVIPKVDANK